MTQELKDIIAQMLFMSDQQLLSEDFKKINFKKKNWFKKYTWKAKTEERFIEWLAEHLKNNWKVLADIKPTTKKQREKIAREFVANYGCVTRPLEIDDFVSVVPWGQLEETMTEDELGAFGAWMYGQTSPLHGAYRWDLEQYLKGGRNYD